MKDDKNIEDRGALDLTLLIEKHQREIASVHNEIQALKKTIAELRNELEHASIDKQEAIQAATSNYNNEIVQLKQSLGQARENLERATAREQEKLKETAKNEANELIEKAKKQIDQEVKLAQQSLKSSTVENVVNLTAKVISKNIDKDSNAKIIESYLEGTNK